MSATVSIPSLLANVGLALNTKIRMHSFDLNALVPPVNTNTMHLLMTLYKVKFPIKCEKYTLWDMLHVSLADMTSVTTCNQARSSESLIRLS